MKIKRLPDSELEVMQILWSMKSPISRAQVEEAMAKIHPIAQTTLLTLLTRLSKKGFVRIEKNGRSSCYTPLISQECYIANESLSFIQKLCGGNMNVFANALCDSGISKEDLQELRDLLDRDLL